MYSQKFSQEKPPHTIPDTTCEKRVLLFSHFRGAKLQIFRKTGLFFAKKKTVAKNTATAVSKLFGQPRYLLAPSFVERFNADAVYAARRTFAVDKVPGGIECGLVAEYGK